MDKMNLLPQSFKDIAWIKTHGSIAWLTWDDLEQVCSYSDLKCWQKISRKWLQ